MGESTMRESASDDHNNQQFFPMLISQQARKVNPHRLNRPQQQNLPIATEVFLVKTDYAPIITNLENVK